MRRIFYWRRSRLVDIQTVRATEERGVQAQQIRNAVEDVRRIGILTNSSYTG